MANTLLSKGQVGAQISDVARKNVAPLSKWALQRLAAINDFGYGGLGSAMLYAMVIEARKRLEVGKG